MGKRLMEGYVGIKFTAECASTELPDSCDGLYEVFERSCHLLRSHDMTPANGGNVSIRMPGGFAVTTAGCNLGLIEEQEIALVTSCSLEQERVVYAGAHEPSSEAMLHWLILQGHPDAGAVVHAHDEVATAVDLSGILPESDREEPYGTVALARRALETFEKGGEIIVLKNHGYVAIGRDLDRATATVVEMHRRLMEAAGLPCGPGGCAGRSG